MKKTDKQVHHDVQHALHTDQHVDGAALDVSVNEGVVTLEGSISSPAEKEEAETAVKQVTGVKAVATEITGQPGENIERIDREIALAAVQHLKRHSFVPEDRILVTVNTGWVTIEGDVSNDHQKRSAESAVSHLAGVQGVTNAITVQAEATPADISAQIEGAFTRRAKIEAGLIQVEVHGNKVILHGTVRSQAKRDEAEAVARATPGVAEVENKLAIIPSG